VEEVRVTRPAVDVRRVCTDDLDDLLLLWTQARKESGTATRALIGHTAEQLRARLASAVRASDVHLLLARWDGAPAGYVVLRVGPLMPVVDDPSVIVENLYVTPDLRRHGVAKALLAGVTSIAERNAADQVVISAPHASREAQRFLARLGFTPLVVRRIAATSALRRRLAGESRRSGIDDLLARRRTLRARAAATPAEGITAASDAPLRESPMREGPLGRLRVQAILSRRVDADLDPALHAELVADAQGEPGEHGETVVSHHRPHDTLELPAISADSPAAAP
jgi:ribosomal protein S18 acetylase RimI-like enzyme